MEHEAESDFAELLERARMGHGEAFETLFRRYNRPVSSFANARRATDPEGVVNEVFLRVFRNLPTFSGSETQFTAWIFRIARNLVIDEVRRQARRLEEITGPVFDGSTERPTDTNHGDPERTLIGNDADQLTAYLEVLTAEQRDVILLRVVAEQPIDVVAATLGKSTSAVKSIQYRATQSLREALEKKSPNSATSLHESTF